MTFGGHIIYLRPRSVIFDPSAARKTLQGAHINNMSRHNIAKESTFLYFNTSEKEG